MPTFSRLPGTLNLEMSRGDSFGVDVDFNADVTGYTVTASMVETTTGLSAAAFTSTIVSGAGGIVSFSLSDTQTAAMAAGTYYWEAGWTSPAGERRTVLTGTAEIRS